MAALLALSSGCGDDDENSGDATTSTIPSASTTAPLDNIASTTALPSASTTLSGGNNASTTTVRSTSTTELVLDDYEATTPPRGGDVILNQLAEKCQAGDMVACDQLYEDSEVDSEYEAYGNSCGGRLSDDNVEYCVDLFGEGTRG